MSVSATLVQHSNEAFICHFQVAWEHLSPTGQPAAGEPHLAKLGQFNHCLNELVIRSSRVLRLRSGSDLAMSLPRLKFAPIKTYSEGLEAPFAAQIAGVVSHAFAQRMQLGCLFDFPIPRLDSKLSVYVLYEYFTSDRDCLRPSLVSRRSTCECSCDPLLMGLPQLPDI
jgi:hypothetical protein